MLLEMEQLEWMPNNLIPTLFTIVWALDANKQKLKKTWKWLSGYHNYY